MAAPRPAVGPGQVSLAANGRKGKGKGRGYAIECYHCGEQGHRRDDCPRKAEAKAEAARPLSDEERLVVDRVVELFRGLGHGYDISGEEKAAVTAVGGSSTYGELEPQAIPRLLRALALTPDDVFFDLGCGTGKVLVGAALGSPVARCVGLELAATRTQIAVDAFRRSELDDRCSAYVEDFVVAPRLADATVCYCCNLTLPNTTFAALLIRMADLPRLRLVATMKNPFFDATPEAADCFGKAFRAAGVQFLHTSWQRGVRVHMYRRR
eukprot:TRINITY_DN48316_c0_g1_i1.p2 TRINITY_DN48316_c0_g1~~TRINITY_DN48316_c0_g1_i1.p2  ORF type:complete len:267 (+),score=71.88 TRINITY_DN48316_c0_g1_i1:150-950(+)